MNVNQPRAVIVTSAGILAVAVYGSDRVEFIEDYKTCYSYSGTNCNAGLVTGLTQPMFLADDAANAFVYVSTEAGEVWRIAYVGRAKTKIPVATDAGTYAIGMQVHSGVAGEPSGTVDVYLLKSKGGCANGSGELYKIRVRAAGTASLVFRESSQCYRSVTIDDDGSVYLATYASNGGVVKLPGGDVAGKVQITPLSKPIDYPQGVTLVKSTVFIVSGKGGLYKLEGLSGGSGGDASAPSPSPKSTSPSPSPSPSQSPSTASSPSPSSSSPATAAEGVGLWGEYFTLPAQTSQLPDLTGRGTPAFQRAETKGIDWKAASPVPWSDLPSDVFATGFVARFTGEVLIEKAGMHTFALNSEEGSKLWLDGSTQAPNVDNDGKHGMTLKQGTPVSLAAEWRKIRIEFFAEPPAGGLILSFAGPGFSSVVVRPALLRHTVPSVSPSSSPTPSPSPVASSTPSTPASPPSPASAPGGSSSPSPSPPSSAASTCASSSYTCVGDGLTIKPKAASIMCSGSACNDVKCCEPTGTSPPPVTGAGKCTEHTCAAGGTLKSAAAGIACGSVTGCTDLACCTPRSAGNVTGGGSNVDQGGDG